MTWPSSPRPPRRRAAFTAAALAGPLIALGLTTASAGPRSHPAGAARGSAAAAAARAAAKKPALSISVSDGRQMARPGALLTYTVKIHNIGRISVPRLKVEQTLPPGLKLISLTQHGARGAGQVSWQVNLPPGHSDTFSVVARVGPMPRRLLRLATVACASMDSHGTPIVCAADSDQLPAGAVITAAHPGQPGPSRGYLQLASLILVVGIAVAGGWWLAIRRHGRRGGA